MATVQVTYHAPKDDSKVVEMGGHTFFDGKPTEIEENPENAHLIENLKTNPHFETGESAGPTTASPPDDYVPAEDEDGDESDDGGKGKHPRRRR